LPPASRYAVGRDRKLGEEVGVRADAVRRHFPVGEEMIDDMRFAANGRE
jgi:hypothetical protein